MSHITCCPILPAATLDLLDFNLSQFHNIIQMGGRVSAAIVLSLCTTEVPGSSPGAAQGLMCTWFIPIPCSLSQVFSGISGFLLYRKNRWLVVWLSKTSFTQWNLGSCTDNWWMLQSKCGYICRCAPFGSNLVDAIWLWWFTIAAKLQRFESSKIWRKALYKSKIYFFKFIF